jgi:hypothetical protein
MREICLTTRVKEHGDSEHGHAKERKAMRNDIKMKMNNHHPVA